MKLKQKLVCILIIKVKTPSRLHFGLIDLNGELGRINGGLGVALENPGWEILGTSNYENNFDNIPVDTKEKISLVINKFDNVYKTNSKKFSFQINKIIPQHKGLGSNTQFSLAIGIILAKIHQIEPLVTEIANVVKRGGTSGIGVASFEAGGIILDGGHSFGPGKQTESFLPSSVSQAPPPPIIFRYYPPEEWRFVLFLPKEYHGPSGKSEVDFFQSKCPIPSQEVEKLSRLILMKILPAIMEKDIRTFGEGITEMQTHFTKFGMNNYDQGLIHELLNELRNQSEVFGSGISSFGPTVYALTDSEVESKAIMNNISEIFSVEKFEFIISSKINRTGAKIKTL